MKAFFEKNWKWIAVVVVVIIVGILIYFLGKSTGKKLGDGFDVHLTDDQGNPITASAADQQKANALASRLQGDLIGVNWDLNHDDTVYNELLQSSNTVFVLTFAKYKELTGNNLTADLNDDHFIDSIFGARWEVVDLIIKKANSLGIA